MVITLGDEDKVPALAYKRVHKKTLYLQSSLEGYIDEMLSLMKEDGNIRACCSSSFGRYQYFTFGIQSVLQIQNGIPQYFDQA